MDIVSEKSNPNYLLQMLIATRGSYISGETISSKIGVTRAAIWKQIHHLRELGYVIESAPRKGYRLVETPDLLIPEEIWAKAEIKGIGQKIHHRFKVDSTNALAKKLAQEGEPHGTVVVAEEQTMGKGRLQRSWISPKGGIWFSLILRPNILPQEAPKLTLLSSVAVARALRSLDIPNISIKWPNDILMGQKKVCGILTELNAEVDAVNYVIIGIGLNVNNTNFPEELRNKATSLYEALSVPLDRRKVLAKVLQSFEVYYELAEEEGFMKILKDWRSLCSNLNTRVKVSGRSGSFEGIALDIDEFGALLVRKNDGNIERVLSGDVSLRKAIE